MTVVANTKSTNQQNSNNSIGFHKLQAGTDGTGPIQDALETMIEASQTFVNGVHDAVDTLKAGTIEQADAAAKFAEGQKDDIVSGDKTPEAVENQAFNSTNDTIDHTGKTRDGLIDATKGAVTQFGDATSSYVDTIQKTADKLADTAKDKVLDGVDTITDAAVDAAEYLNAYGQALADYTTDVATYAYEYGKDVGEWGIDVGEWASNTASDEANDADGHADRTEDNARDLTLSSKAEAVDLARFLVEESWDLAAESADPSPVARDLLAKGQPAKETVLRAGERADERSSEEAQAADSYSDGVEERLEQDAEDLGNFIWSTVNEGYKQVEDTSDAAFKAAVGHVDETADTTGRMVGEGLDFTGTVADGVVADLRQPKEADGPDQPGTHPVDAPGGPVEQPEDPAMPETDDPGTPEADMPSDDGADDDTVHTETEADGHAGIGPVGVSGHADMEAGIA